MIKLRKKEEVLKEYVSRYSELDNFFMEELSKDYDRYVEILKDCNTKEEYYEIFRKEIKANEQRYKDNSMIKGVEGSTYDQFMDILAQYGLITFFRDNMLDE